MRFDEWPIIRQLPVMLRNKYILVLLGYMVYMIFFDSNDFRSQARLFFEKRKLEKEEAYYKKQIRDVQKEHDMLFSDMAHLERFAREHYLMKRDSEDIFVIVER